MGFLVKVLAFLLSIVLFGGAMWWWGPGTVVITIVAIAIVGGLGKLLITKLPLFVGGVVVIGGSFLLHRYDPLVVTGGVMVIGILFGVLLVWAQFKISGSGGKKR